MEVYAKIDTVECNLEEEDQGRLNCGPSTFVSPNPANSKVLLANETPASSVPKEVCVSEQEPGVASSPCRQYTTDLNSTAEPSSSNTPTDLSSQSPTDISDDVVEEEESFQTRSGNEASDSDTVSIINGFVKRIGKGGVTEPITEAPSSYYAPSSSFLSHINLEAMSSNEIPGLFKPGSWNENEELYPGLLFPTRESLGKAVKMYSITRKQTFMVFKSSSKYLDVRCHNYGKSCSWRVRACKKNKLKMWEITKYEGPHTCVSVGSQDHMKLDSDIIASNIANIVNEKPDVSIPQIIQMMKDRFSYTVSYKKAWNAKQKAIAKEYDDWQGSYSQLPRWMAAVQFYLPGTVVEFVNKEYEKDGNRDSEKEFFHRVFWAFKPCIDAFHHSKPVVQIDALPLYGKYRGTLFIGSSQDGDQSIVPIVFAIVEGETVEAWSWFLELLNQYVVKDRQGVCLISDRHPAILESIRNNLQWQPPHAYHVFCIRHLASNFHKMFKNVGLKSLFISVDRAKQVSSQIEDGKMFSETVNEALSKNRERASSSIVRMFDMDATQFEVEEPFDPQGHQFGRICRVNLRDKQCDCGEFQAHKYPCSHVIAACEYVSHDYLVYVDPVYRLETILNVYRSKFHPIGGEHHWPTVTGPTLVPNPSVLRLKGRPRSTFRDIENDKKKSRKINFCSKCSGTGHNSKNC
ncbi:uncharacterized protein G2W53_018797 [Senna tora]|uniref:SWIM-type domain-containing protein n=1 Tax=Senna tora TaxID=362788 RepID=A0A834TT40_9FABA|nr:uncharacterized protein G2W53_018797 [Senna tora]